MEMDRITADINSHADNQALNEVRHCLGDIFLGQLFPDSLQGDFQLISRLIRLGSIL